MYTSEEIVAFVKAQVENMNIKATPYNNIQRDKLPILRINALAFFVIASVYYCKKPPFSSSKSFTLLA